METDKSRTFLSRIDKLREQMKKFNTVIFDLDGVLIDSKENMRVAWEQVRKKLNVKQKFNNYFKNIGLPFDKILKNIGIKKNTYKITKLYKNQSIINLYKLKLMPGVIQTIKKLNKKNVKIAIVTSKDIKRTKLIVKKLKIPIKVLISPRKNLRGKPYPDQLNLAIKNLKSDKKKACYIGDMNVDYIAAKNSKISFVFAKYGYQKLKKKYKIVIKKPKEILKFI